MPTGFRFAGASRDLAPLNGSNTCLGMIMPRLPQKASAQNGCGRAKPILIVWLSTLSIFAISRYEPSVTAAVAGSITNSHVKTTSSAVNGLPSCQVTPFLRRQVTEVPSFASKPLATDGISAASTGTRLPSGS